MGAYKKRLWAKSFNNENKQGGQVHIYETENPNQKNSRFRVDTGTHYNLFNTLEEAKQFAEKHWGPEGNKPSKSTAERMKDYVNAMNRANGEFAGAARKQRASSEAFKQEMLNELNGEYKRSSEDAAPRELTGDTCIRIRK